MTEFKAVDPEQVLSAVKAGVEGIADVLNRTFDGQFQVASADIVEPFSGTSALGLDGPMLVIQGDLESGCAVAVLPASAGIAPDWCSTPDDTQQSKLGSLAQEFFFSTIPEDFFAADQRFDYLTSADPLEKIEFVKSAQLIRVSIQSEAGEGELLLIWASQHIVDLSAAAEPGETADATASQSGEAGLAPEPDQQPSDSEASRRIQFNDLSDGIVQLPIFARSILKIPVPVRVVLAARKMTVGELGELAPGSIIEFKKSHEQPLTLEIGTHQLAEGEAVRVGEKFGLWITAITLPGERFSVSDQA